MVRRLSFLLYLIALAPGVAFAGNISFSSSAGDGAIQTVQTFAYSVDNDAFAPDLRIPGLGGSTAAGNGLAIGSSENFGPDVVIDPAMVAVGQSLGCLSGAAEDTAFCAQPYWSPNATVRVGDKTVLLTTPSGDYLADGDPFSANNTFAGAEAIRATLSSDVPTVVPEPSSMILLGTGIVGIAAIFRARKL